MRPLVHIAGEKAILPPTGAFGLVHRHIGRAQQLVDTDSAVGKVRDADAGAQGYLGAIDLVPHRDQFDEFFRDPRGVLRLV